MLSKTKLLSEMLKLFKLKINPNNADVITKIGVSYKNLNKLNKAIEFHKKALCIDPKNPSIF